MRFVCPPTCIDLDCLALTLVKFKFVRKSTQIFFFRLATQRTFDRFIVMRRELLNSEQEVTVLYFRRIWIEFDTEEMRCLNRALRRRPFTGQGLLI